MATGQVTLALPQLQVTPRPQAGAGAALAVPLDVELPGPGGESPHACEALGQQQLEGTDGEKCASLAPAQAQALAMLLAAQPGATTAPDGQRLLAASEVRVLPQLWPALLRRNLASRPLGAAWPVPQGHSAKAGRLGAAGLPILRMAGC